MEQLLRGRINAVLRNHVPGEREFGSRIVNHGRKRAVVPIEHGSRRDRVDALKILPLAEGFIIRHEEKLVPSVKQLWDSDRSVQFEAVLIPLEGVLLLRAACEGVRLRI